MGTPIFGARPDFMAANFGTKDEIVAPPAVLFDPLELANRHPHDPPQPSAAWLRGQLDSEPVLIVSFLNATSRALTARWLYIRLHVDAFLLNPGPYLAALKWWLLRKRVRARGQFAPLLSQSPLAYEFWAVSRPDRAVRPQPATAPKILALVSVDDDAGSLVLTLESLKRSGVPAITVQPPAEAGLPRIAEHALFQSAQWLMPVRAGDLVASHVAEAYQAMIAKLEQTCALIYSDDDSIDARGNRKNPHLKPAWNSELQRHHDIVTGACIVRASAANLVEAARHADWVKALIAGAAERGPAVHIPDMLHHRRWRPEPPAEVAPLVLADVLPLVSVIIPTRNRADLLRTCIGGLRATRYPNIEIIVANNGSDDAEALSYLAQLAGEGVHVIDQPGPFNYSTINNNAVAAARGELLCLLNNDIEVLSPDWLAIMATQALRPKVGAVGAQLLYPDGRIQHAGVVIGVGNAAGHAHRFLRPEAEGYFRRHALPQYVTAVTAACLVVRKDRFLAVGGLDATNFPVAFNDVDLCLKLNKMGWQSFYEPRAVLVHHESVSRGHDTDPVGAARFAGELAALQRIWRTNEIVDPFHHPMLSRASEQFALDLASIALPLS
jgi:GT2 family glycosyltransferase